MNNHFFGKRCCFLLLGVCLVLTGMLSGCSQTKSPSTETIVKENASNSYSTDLFAMDTVMTLTAYGTNAQTAVEASTKEIQNIEQIFSTNLQDSALAQLNSKKTASLPDEAVTVLQTALQLHMDTDGAFNIALYPVVKAWGFTTENYRIPAPEELAALLRHTDIGTLSLDTQAKTAQLTDSAAEIDLGGIVKGYTSDRVMQLLAQQGIQSAVISLGGNVQTLGVKPDGSLWRVGIQDPNNPDDCICLVQVADKAVITSGPYQRYFIGDDGVRYHHIINPQTGAPAESGLASVTIVSDSGILADGLSTSLFVMGSERALQYWQEHRQEFDAILITTDRQIIVTAGLADCFQSDSNYYVFGE